MKEMVSITTENDAELYNTTTQELTVSPEYFHNNSGVHQIHQNGCVSADISTFIDTIRYFSPTLKCLEEINDVLTQIATYCSFSNSCLNPVLYVIVGKNFQKKAVEFYKDLFTKSSRFYADTSNNGKPLQELLQITEQTSENQSNSTVCPDLEDWWHIVYYIVPKYINTVCVIGMLGNVFVLFIYSLHKGPLKIAEIYLMNLAVADLIFLMCLPFWAENINNEFNWPFGTFLCRSISASITLNMYTSIYLLVAVSVDRYLTFVHTLNHREIWSKTMTKRICLLIWFFSILLSIPAFTFRTVKDFPQWNISACTLDFPTPSWQTAESLLHSQFEKTGTDLSNCSCTHLFHNTVRFGYALPQVDWLMSQAAREPFDLFCFNEAAKNDSLSSSNNRNLPISSTCCSSNARTLLNAHSERDSGPCRPRAELRGNTAWDTFYSPPFLQALLFSLVPKSDFTAVMRISIILLNCVAEHTGEDLADAGNSSQKKETPESCSASISDNSSLD
ncbi:hypothetical protein IHE44_0013704 [Lamprotornis superbus]|uniref:G-protein coupled receptors family 1 profile domain-containing protein n=1 Tax=Lamprotornis superbus TaxID=245042 RepID=A0A835NYH2_9PASS|nr:hypothetical protein IHE44_0013704 [Lamprotornis superbus]